jgi:hypothetical protein
MRFHSARASRESRANRLPPPTEGMIAEDRLTFYAEQFDTVEVEVDSTFESLRQFLRQYCFSSSAESLPVPHKALTLSVGLVGAGGRVAEYNQPSNSSSFFGSSALGMWI